MIARKTSNLISVIKNRLYFKQDISDIKPESFGISVVLATVIIGIVLSLLPVTELSAMPPYQGLTGKLKAGQLSEPYFLKHKDEFLARGVNAPGDLLTKRIDMLAKSTISGNINILTILVDFSDKAATESAIFFDTLVYVNVNGSVNNYYKEVSYNTLSITTVVLPSSLGWTRAPQTYAYYCNNQNGLGTYPQNAQKLVEDAVDAVDASVNFTQFDNDLDGYVDGMIVVHSGPGAEFTGQNTDIWSHKWGITARLKDGVYISTYSMEPEYWSSVGDMTLGVYCHELGHVFGLPDLYDTDDSSEGIGNWSLMAGGSWNGTLGGSPAHLDAWSKIQLGFVTPNVLSTDQTSVSIPNVENSQTIYKLWTNGTPANEYFLLENRQQTGYDSGLPSNGLLIWHIDDNLSNNQNEWWPGCGWSQHYMVALVQADNLWDMEHNLDRGDTGDPYPGSTSNTTFNSSSSPSSYAYTGGATSVAVTNISSSSSTMTADMSIGVPQFIDDNHAIPDLVVLYQNVPNPFNSITNIEFQLARESVIGINIYDLNGNLVKNLYSGSLNRGYHKINWNGTNCNNQLASSGVYFYRLSIGDNCLSRNMLMLK